ncbi:MAG: hypothetical protein HC893_06095 [Chloroflexaceae bacterium]|nr:hypothetical protein [Chloroflexaceae bacterium]
MPAFFVDGTLDNAGALVEVPFSGNEGMYYQTWHELPILYGEHSRDVIPGRLLFHLRDGITTDDDMMTDARQNWYCALDYYTLRTWCTITTSAPIMTRSSIPNRLKHS